MTQLPISGSDESEFLTRLFGAAADGVILIEGHSEKIMRNPNLAMYSAKSKGRNTYQIFEASMYETARKHLISEQESRRQ